MSGSRILLKLTLPEGNAPKAKASLGVGGPPLKLEPLFQQTHAATAAMGAATPRPQAWFIATGAGRDAFGPASAHPWDLAHTALSNGLGLAGNEIAAIEPDLEQSWVTEPPRTAGLGAAVADCCAAAGQKGTPLDIGSGFGWHLDDAHSGLRAAREAVGPDGSDVTIVHLDTGYDGDHRALPVNLAGADLQRNFVEGGNSAIDQTPQSGLLTNRGHGTGTIGILAGASMDGLTSLPAVPKGFGPLGGAPLARVVPVRIANSVVHFWTSTVARGIDYAREIGADVLSMSMGGLPSAAWADAVNAAYDAGVVLVCAAGNSFGGLPTSLIVYPARFQRVIAACGVMAEGHPYYGLRGPMEGCVGPASKMATAMAAYTPNIPWLKLGCPQVVDMDGAGTSAATPQVAAAAALWLVKHGSKYPRGWQRVEAVRTALFAAAQHGGGTEPDQYFGRGLLRARAALDIVPDLAHLVQTGGDSSSFAFLHLLSSALGAAPTDPRRLNMFRLELTQLALNSRGLREAVPEPELPPDQIPDHAVRRGLVAVMDEGLLSMSLRDHLSKLLGRTGVGMPGSLAQHLPSPLLPSASTVQASRQGAHIPRRIAIPMPSRRRLRVFATDPGDSVRLETSFINMATIEVPWEDIEPGPVGEYLEVVDVDPASNAAYPPVDLEDRHLLAQDGIAPSEGNPQFHQQMTYAVAMRTIRNFEIALGRRALWSERRMPRDDGTFQPAPDDGYVQRLRIYPHGLREENAYYSPNRKALLFGYYNDYAGPSRGRQVVFTCLSHDIIAHETTHALLDGLHRRFQESTNPDVLAFHEAFADIVAIFQHFTFPELLRYEMGRLHGDLSRASILSDLARQFGQSLHNARALRMAITPGSGSSGDVEEPGAQLQNYRDAHEPHERGAILVAAVFEAFVAIYIRRTQDLIRLATAGSGVLTPGAIHPDLVERLAQAAVEIAQSILTRAIRALDYMPPVDPTFGDYLRAIVTADADIAPDHGMGYRVAFAEAFARRGIYPIDVPSVSPDGLLWQASIGAVQSTRLNSFIQSLDLESYAQDDRRLAFGAAKRNAAELHTWLAANLDHDMAVSLGLDFGLLNGGGKPRFEVHSVRPAIRTTADGEHRTDVVAVLTQWRNEPVDPGQPPGGPTFVFRGGCTLLLDRSNGTDPIRYAICRPINDDTRADAVRKHLYGTGPFGIDSRYDCDQDDGPSREPFAALHMTLGES